MLGTLANAGAIFVGSVSGIALNRRIKISENRSYIQIMGVFVCWIGFQSTQVINSGSKFVVTLGAIVLGAAAGEVFGLEKRVEQVVHLLERRFGAVTEAEPDSGRRDRGFLRAFVSSTLLFCVGPMAILGSIQDGLRHDPSLLISKAVLDGVVSVALAASLGVGIAVSSLSVLLYQGLLTLLAQEAQTIISHQIIDGISASGGMMLIFTGLNMIGATRISVMNLLPAIVLGALAANVCWH